MVTVQKSVLHLVDICSLVQNIESRFVAERSRFVAGSEKNKSGAKRASKADSHPGPPNKVIGRSKEDISEKNNGYRPFKYMMY